jgi:hypothetical protein
MKPFNQGASLRQYPEMTVLDSAVNEVITELKKPSLKLSLLNNYHDITSH